MTEFIHPLRVYYEDTDVAGIVYHGSYVRFFERGRTEWLRSLGFDQELLIEQGLAFAVTEMDIKFRKAARFNALLEVVTTVATVGNASMVFEQRIRDAEEPGVNYSKATVKVCCVDMATMKPQALPEALRKTIKH
jgi:acyl-CoA thioester hydrolase